MDKDPKAETERSDITFSAEKKACLNFLFKCWQKCSKSKAKEG